MASATEMEIGVVHGLWWCRIDTMHHIV